MDFDLEWFGGITNGGIRAWFLIMLISLNVFKCFIESNVSHMLLRENRYVPHKVESLGV